MSITVEGVPELQASMRRLATDLGDLSAAHRDAGSLVGRRASAAAPKRSGRLAASMRSDAAAAEARVTFRARYANPVHWGTGPRPGLRGPHNIRRNPFAWNAAQDTEAQWVPIYEKQVGTYVSHVKGA